MSNGEEMVCAREGCEVRYVKKTHNQKYHDDDCCKIATNQRVMKNYYANRERRAGKVRICNTCKVTKLSRYNDSLTCSGCQAQREADANTSVANMLQGVAWQA